MKCKCGAAALAFTEKFACQMEAHPALLLTVQGFECELCLESWAEIDVEVEPDKWRALPRWADSMKESILAR